MINLYKHQEDIIKDDPKKCLFALGTGSAKTLTALLLAEGRILCITPKQQREEQNFIREAKKWDLTKDITQMSKEDFKKHASSLGQYDTVIIDEAHTVAGITPNIRYKNKQPIPKASQLYDKLITYLDKYPPTRLYLLTATPTRSAMCVYGLARLLGKKWNFYEYRDIFYISIKKGYREFFMPRTDERVKDRLGKIVRSLGYTGRLEDYFDVPDQMFKDIFVEQTKEQKDRLVELALEYPDPLVRTGKSHQVENGVLAGNEFSAPEVIKDNKIDVLKDLAIEFPKLVIFARYTAQIKKIEKELSAYNVITLQGDTKNRGEVIEKANNAQNCIIIIQSQISAGFELPTFPVMVFASMDYSIVNYTQGIGRILRANALKKNLYIHLVTRGGVDQAVYKSIKNKETFSEKIYAEKN
jgi:superfamily II DNA or RNA helicase